jgi:hypothetical protein
MISDPRATSAISTGTHQSAAASAIPDPVKRQVRMMEEDNAAA